MSAAGGASHVATQRGWMRGVTRFGALVVALVAALFVPTVLRAQEAPALRVDLVSIAESDYPDAKAVINVEDESGSTITGLSASNFVVSVDGHPAAVRT